MASAAEDAGRGKPQPKEPRRGVSLGLVGLLFMLLTPLGLAVAWWHPAFRKGKRRDPLLVLAVLVYLSTVVYAFAFFEE